jgi:hypothetical protein
MNDDQHSKQTAFTGALKLAGHVQDVNISIASMIFRSARRVEAAVFVVVVVVLALRWDQTSFCSARCAVCTRFMGPDPFPAHLGAKFDSGTSELHGQGCSAAK